MAEKAQNLKEILEIASLIPLSPSVLRRAGQSFPTVIGTLDALHLASALLCVERHGLKLVFLTHDIRQALAAQALGFECRGFETARS